MPPSQTTPAAAVVLYGPPASGKDTVTNALVQQYRGSFEHFRPLKAGPGRTTGYRLTTAEALDELRATGGLLWETHRYDAVYGVDEDELTRLLRRGAVPVLHLAEPAAVPRLRRARPGVRWLVVELWCPRDVAECRARARQTGDVDARLAAYDAFQPPDQIDLRINTARTPPGEAATAIAKLLHRS